MSDRSLSKNVFIGIGPIFFETNKWKVGSIFTSRLSYIYYRVRGHKNFIAHFTDRRPFKIL